MDAVTQFKAQEKYKEEMSRAAQAFICELQKMGFVVNGFSVSQNMYGVSIYFDGLDYFGKSFKFRYSDHDCQRANGVYTKLGPSSCDRWLFEYEKQTFPERFEWQYFDKYIINPKGERVQCKMFIGRC